MDFHQPDDLLKRLWMRRTVRAVHDHDKAERIDRNLIAAMIEDAKCLASFTLKLEGDALAPDVFPVSGDAVIALIQGKYGCMLLNADGDLWDRNGGFVPHGFYTICGVVLDRTLRNP